MPENSSDQTSCHVDPLDELLLDEVLDEEELDDEFDEEELAEEEFEEELFDELDELEPAPLFPPQATNERLAMIAKKIRCTSAPTVKSEKKTRHAAGV